VNRIHHLTIATAVVAGVLTACSTEPTLKISGATTTTMSSTSSTVSESTALTTTTTPAPQPTAPSTEQATAGATYEVVDPPMLDGAQTDTFTADGEVADGRYWVVYHGSDGVTPYITLYVAYFGEACVAKAAELDDECFNDIFVAPTPMRDLVDIPFSDTAYITVADVRTADSLLIDATELVLASTGTPSATAPELFEFIPFAFIATIVDGEIIGFEQVWTP
jgi:hypothetical protein